MEQKQPVLQPIQVRDPPKPPQTTLKVKLTNKLQISPLGQELKGLGPMTPTRDPRFKEPVFTRKYTHREVILPSRKISPATHQDPDKPSLLNKQKALKLVLLQKTIN